MIRVIMFILVTVPFLSLNAQSSGGHAELTETVLWLQSDELVAKQQGWFDNSTSAWISRGAMAGAATLDIWSALHLQNKAAQSPTRGFTELNPLFRNNDGTLNVPKIVVTRTLFALILEFMEHKESRKTRWVTAGVWTALAVSNTIQVKVLF